MLCLPRTGVSQVVLGASKTRRSDFDRRIPSENKKSTGSWRDIGVVRSCTLHVFVLHRCPQLTRRFQIDAPTIRQLMASISPREGRDKGRMRLQLSPSAACISMNSTPYSIHLEEKERNMLVGYLLCRTQKHVQKFESSILLLNTLSLRAMQAKLDFKHPECQKEMTDAHIAVWFQVFRHTRAVYPCARLCTDRYG